MYRTFVRRPNLETPEYEVLPKDMALQETPLQKLRRLMYEVKELGQEAELNNKVKYPPYEPKRKKIQCKVEHWYDMSRSYWHMPMLQGWAAFD